MTKRSGVFVDENRTISKLDRKRIEKSLKPRVREGVDVAAILTEIEFATQHYWASAESEHRRQKSSQIARELYEVAAYAGAFPQSAAELSKTLRHLGEDSDEALEQNWQKIHAERPKSRRREIFLSLEVLCSRIADAHLWPTEVSADLRRRVRQLKHAALAFQARGRPRQDAMGAFINVLALIYEAATGRWPGRTWDYNRDQERHPYFEACFRAAGLSTKESRKKLGMIRPILRARKQFVRTMKPA